MKRYVLAILAFMTLSLRGAEAAPLLLNGDFELGNTLFSSAYTYVAPGSTAPLSGNPSTLWDEGTYTVATNPHNIHNSFYSFGDHTSGSGNMLVANGDAQIDTIVWTGHLAQNLVVGTQYIFKFWATSVYPASPAQLSFHIGDVQTGSLVLPTITGLWIESTTSFVATSPTQIIDIRDDNRVANGNDFALDDISLTAMATPDVPPPDVTTHDVPTPEPATIVLLGGGLAALIAVRRRVRG